MEDLVKKGKNQVKILSKRTKNPKICAGILMIFRCDSTIIDIKCMVQLPGNRDENALDKSSVSQVTVLHTVSH